MKRGEYRPGPRQWGWLGLIIFIFQFSIFNQGTSLAAKKDYDREISRQKRELDDIRDRLQREQQALANLKERQESTLGTLERLAENIRLAEEYLDKLDSTEQTLERSLAGARADLGEVERRIGERD
ncbi:MAG TPA: hypothetical protein VK150_10025, partial [Geothrix sp.]|nr:hypothetical protein [Geothrix sp.]